MAVFEDVIVISDVHLSVDRGGWFRADALLTHFLRWVLEEATGCHLFFNGDIFDFLASNSQPGINPAEAEQQVTAIAKSHPEVFGALSSIMNSKQHDVTILGGNHDPELALHNVQTRLEQELKISSSQLHVRWLTNGEGALFNVGDANVLIEHGDQYDPWNWIDHEALRRTICLASRNISYADIYNSPPGSRLVVNRLSHLRKDFNWIETLQPLTPSLLPLMLEVILPAVDSKTRNQLLNAVREFKDFGKRSLIEKTLTLLNSRARYWDYAGEEKQVLVEWLAQYNDQGKTWSIAADVADALSRAAKRLRTVYSDTKLRKAARLSSFFQIEAEDEQLPRVTELLNYGSDLVLHGHTHAAKAYAMDRGLYINTGTWTRLTTLPDSNASDDEWTAFLNKLKANKANYFDRPTFARIRTISDTTTASLCEWTSGGPKVLASWDYRNKRWEKGTNEQ
jgi:UDP-2,3-diacylglucosamine pyrophosphatase LpxH